MDELNKTQLILLVLFVSFVTSIATGITTVTLLEEAPLSVTQPINRIVRETVKVVVPDKSSSKTVTQTIVVKEEDFVVEAVEKNSPNTIKVGYVPKKGIAFDFLGVGSAGDGAVEYAGSGFVLREDGTALLPDSLFDDSRSLVAQSLSGETSFEIELLRRNAKTGLALVLIKPVPVSPAIEGKPVETPVTPFVSIVFADSLKVKIGQTAIALGADEGLRLLLGVVSRLAPGGEQASVGDVYTTIDTDARFSGGPLLNTNAEVIGINIVTAGGERFTIPAQTIQAILAEYDAEKAQGETAKEQKPL